MSILAEYFSSPFRGPLIIFPSFMFQYHNIYQVRSQLQNILDIAALGVEVNHSVEDPGSIPAGSEVFRIRIGVPKREARRSLVSRAR